MLISDYITPVMYTDSTGYSWMSDLWSDFIDWLNSVPESSVTIPSLAQVGNILLNIFGGGTLGIIKAETDIRINSGFGYGSFEKLTRFLNKTGNFLGKAAIAIPLLFDIGNALTENNSNTIWQRGAKVGVILLNTTIVAGSAYVGAGLTAGGFVTGNLGAVLGGGIIIVAGVSIAEYVSQSIYDWLDIE